MTEFHTLSNDVMNLIYDKLGYDDAMSLARTTDESGDIYRNRSKYDRESKSFCIDCSFGTYSEENVTITLTFDNTNRANLRFADVEKIVWKNGHLRMYTNRPISMKRVYEIQANRGYILDVFNKIFPGKTIRRVVVKCKLAKAFPEYKVPRVSKKRDHCNLVGLTLCWQEYNDPEEKEIVRSSQRLGFNFHSWLKNKYMCWVSEFNFYNKLHHGNHERLLEHQKISPLITVTGLASKIRIDINSQLREQDFCNIDKYIAFCINSMRTAFEEVLVEPDQPGYAEYVLLAKYKLQMFIKEIYPFVYVDVPESFEKFVELLKEPKFTFSFI